MGKTIDWPKYPDKLLPLAEWQAIKVSADDAYKTLIQSEVERMQGTYQKLRRTDGDSLPTEEVIPDPFEMLGPNLARLRARIERQNYLFHKLIGGSHRELEKPKSREIIASAAASSDTDFFVHLGRILDACSSVSDRDAFPTLRLLLIHEWAGGVRRISNRGSFRGFRREVPGDHIPLCFFTEQAITAYVAIKLRWWRPNEETSLDDVVAKHNKSVEKTWRRTLQLKPARRKFVRSVSVKSGKLHFDPVASNIRL